MTRNQCFEVLGYFASSKRMCRLDAELHAKSRKGFISKYLQLTGARRFITPGKSYFSLQRNADKWGIELRINFNAIKSNIPLAVQAMVRAPSPKSNFEFRINQNRLLWCFIKHGFRLGNAQKLTLIRKYVPVQNLSAFKRGVNIP